MVTVNEPAQALGIASALLAGGLNVIEITLRTNSALEAIGAVKNAHPDMCVGAGTVMKGDDLANATSAGADFAVTPGVTPKLLDSLALSSMAAIPGAQTSSEVMVLLEAGFEVIKFFPAEAGGGVDAIKAMAGPLADAQFVPTGGIGPANAGAYLDLPNVLAVGGSWIAPAKTVEAGDWEQISRNAEAIVKL